MDTVSAGSSLNRFRTTGRLLTDRAARAYTAGWTVNELGEVCAALHKQRFLTTVCYWNHDADTPRQVAAAYLGLIDVVATLDRESYLSIKAPALKFDQSLLDHIVNRCQRSHLSLHFDSLAPQDRPKIRVMIERIYGKGVPLSLTLPARWRCSMIDAEAAIEMGLRVRIVKGQWPDIEQPDVDPSEGFLTLIDQLAGRAKAVAVATHDAPLAAEALRRLRIAHTPCELEVMHGYPRRQMCDIARTHATPVRVYIPYGRAWLPYRIRSVSENPRVLVWLLRDLLRSA